MKLHFRGHKTNRVPKWLRILFRIEKLNHENLNSIKIINEKSNSYVDDNILIKLKDENKKKKSRTTHKILELIKNDLKRTKEIEMMKHVTDLILIEWKELGRKVENIFFYINFLIVFILPTVLFYKYLFQDLSADESLQKHCKCDKN